MSLTAIELLDLMENVIGEDETSEDEKLREWSPEYNDQFYGDEDDFSDEEDYDDEDYASDEWGDDEEEDDWEDEEDDAYDYYGESIVPKQVKIRGGKLVKIAAHQKRRMTSKQKMALAAARKRAHTGMANRLRAKSMKVRSQKGM